MPGSFFLLGNIKTLCFDEFGIQLITGPLQKRPPDFLLFFHQIFVLPPKEQHIRQCKPHQTVNNLLTVFANFFGCFFKI